MKKHIQAFLSEKDNHLVQFIKYGMCGGAALAVDVTVTFLTSVFLFKALGSDDQLVLLFENFGVSLPVVTDETVRMRNFLVDCSIAFIFSNLTAYVLNIKYVFKAGRHNQHREVIYFYLVSSIALLITLGLSAVLIKGFGLTSSITKVVGIISAVLINYAGRKFFIFHG